jgi:hypothetical protein
MVPGRAPETGPCSAAAEQLQLFRSPPLPPQCFFDTPPPPDNPPTHTRTPTRSNHPTPVVIDALEDELYDLEDELDLAAEEAYVAEEALEGDDGTGSSAGAAGGAATMADLERK